MSEKKVTPARGSDEVLKESDDLLEKLEEFLAMVKTERSTYARRTLKSRLNPLKQKTGQPKC